MNFSNNVEGDAGAAEPDQIYVASRLRNVLKRTREQGVLNTVSEILAFPFDVLRQITIPPPDYENYDKNKLAIIPLTIGFAFCLLMGFIGQSHLYTDEEEKNEQRKSEWPIVLTLMILLIPGLALSVFIKMTFYASQPPEWFMKISAIVCFLMSIAWINFAAGCVVDMLKVFGFITTLP